MSIHGKSAIFAPNEKHYIHGKSAIFAPNEKH